EFKQSVSGLLKTIRPTSMKLDDDGRYQRTREQHQWNIAQQCRPIMSRLDDQNFEWLACEPPENPEEIEKSSKQLHRRRFVLASAAPGVGLHPYAGGSQSIDQPWGMLGQRALNS